VTARDFLTAIALALALLVPSGCALVTPSSGDGVAIEFDEAEGVRPTELRRFARRELTAFRVGGNGPAALADAAYSMERGLAGQGNAHARVTFTMEPSEEAVERVVFHVDAGPRVTLGDVEFTGVEALTPEELAPFRVFPGSGFLRRGPPIFLRSAIEDALGRLERVYLERGYHQVRVGPAEVSWSADDTRADVRVPVVEGVRFVVSAVQLEGELSAALRAELEPLVAETGSPFLGRTPSTLASRVRGALLDGGHQLAQVHAFTETDAASGRVVIRLEVEPGPVVLLREVRIEGLERTSEDFVRGRIELAPGRPIRRAAVDDSVDALYRAGIFRSVRPTLEMVTGPQGEGPPSADLVFDLAELDARTIDLELGWGSYELLRGRVSYRDRNLFGSGRVLDVTTKLSIRSLEANGRISDRDLLGPSWTLSSGAGYERREEPSFTRNSLRYDATVRKDFFPGLHAETGYHLRAQDATSVQGEIRRAEEDGLVRSAGLFGRVTRDSRDDPLFPTSGVLAQAGMFWSDEDLGGQLDFLEVNLGASAFFALGPDTVLAFSGRLRTRDPLDERRTLPIQERLFLGGENSVRSFGESELGPTDGSDDPRGGLTSASASVELRQRLFDDLAGALFYDVGTVSPRSWTFSDPSGVGVGIGLRYHLPVGPARLDFAYNPGERFAASRGWALHFSFGFAF